MPCFLITITLPSTCGKKKLAKHQKFSKHYDYDCLLNFRVVTQNIEEKKKKKKKEVQFSTISRITF